MTLSGSAKPSQTRYQSGHAWNRIATRPCHGGEKMEWSLPLPMATPTAISNRSVTLNCFLCGAIPKMKNIILESTAGGGFALAVLSPITTQCWLLVLLLGWILMKENGFPSIDCLVAGDSSLK